MQLVGDVAGATHTPKLPTPCVAFGVPIISTEEVLPAAAGMDKVALWVVPSMVAEPTSAFPRVTATCSEVKAAGVCKSVRVTVNGCARAGVKEYSAGGATLGRPMMLA